MEAWNVTRVQTWKPNCDVLKFRVTTDHLSGKPGNVWKFDSCQGNVGNFTKSQGIVREKMLSGKVA